MKTMDKSGRLLIFLFPPVRILQLSDSTESCNTRRQLRSIDVDEPRFTYLNHVQLWILTVEAGFGERIKRAALAPSSEYSRWYRQIAKYIAI